MQCNQVSAMILLMKQVFTTTCERHNNSPNNRWIQVEVLQNKVKTVPLARKVMAIVFWDSLGVVLNDYLEKGKSINCKYDVTSVVQVQMLF